MGILRFALVALLVANLAFFCNSACRAAVARPKVVVFTSSWAFPCKLLQEDLKQGMNSWGDQIEVQIVDVDDPNSRALVDEYDVNPIPTLVLLNARGAVQSYSVGYSGKSGLEWQIRKLLNKT
jgi:thiol-disulfide isomerase/thioredoxin